MNFSELGHAVADTAVAFYFANQSNVNLCAYMVVEYLLGKTDYGSVLGSIEQLIVAVIDKAKQKRSSP